MDQSRWSDQEEQLPAADHQLYFQVLQQIALQLIGILYFILQVVLQIGILYFILQVLLQIALQ